MVSSCQLTGAEGDGVEEEPSVLSPKTHLTVLGPSR